MTSLAHEDCTLESNPLRSLQPVELVQSRSDVVELNLMVYCTISVPAFAAKSF